MSVTKMRLGLRGMLLVLALVVTGPGLVCSEEPLSPEEKQKLVKQAAKLDNKAFPAYKGGDGSKAVKLFAESLKIRERLYQGEDHPDLANSLNNMGEVLESLGKADKALPFYDRALKMRERLYKGQDHSNLARILNNMGDVLESLGKADKALPFYDRALKMRERLFKDQDHPDLALSLNNMGFVLQSLGQADKALPFYDRALKMRERLFKDQDHPGLAISLNNMGVVLQLLGKADKALPFYDRALKMEERLHKDQDHPDLAQSLNNMGYVLQSLGQVDKALPFYDRALKMEERLHKDQDHHDLAQSLNNMGSVLESLEQADKALPFYDRALKMEERLHKDQDHPDLAQSLNLMGFVLQSLEQADKALPFYDRALKMRERLHKDQDHPDLAHSLNNMGVVLESLGKADKALPFCDRALKMEERLHKDQDHHDLAQSLNNMGFLQRELGQPAKALACWERLFQVNACILKREVAFAPEAEALERLQTLGNARSPYLELTRKQPTEPTVVAGHLWNARAVVSRVIERRHFAAQDTDEIRDLRTKLAGLRAQLTAALRRPITDTGREGLIGRLTIDKEAVERQLLQLLPPRVRPGKDITPADLAAVLAADAVYLDLLRYEEIDNQKKPQPHYSAFLHTKAKVVRIDLGPAKIIDDAANDWLHAVRVWASVPPKNRAEHEQKIADFADKIRELVWAKVAKSLPAKLATVYLTVEGDLGRFPFAVLPDGKDSVLLEKYAFIQVPHGPALVEHLRSPAGKDDGKGNLLAVGGVRYGNAPEGKEDWSPLPGTAAERTQLEKLTGGRAKPSLGGTDATTASVLAALPEARYAHLATHGQFNAVQFEADRKQLAAFRERLKTFEVGNGIPPRSGLGTRSPLGYVGLVLAGANQPDKAGADGGILSGEAIAGLQLEKLRLVVLSACETGLGANTDTEGVRGLQRAFHVAGCPAVVASLWEVNDEATAALMNVFWEKVLDRDNPMSPAQALREAQLKVYLNPHLITTLATRGGGFRDLVKVNPDKAPAPPKDYTGPRRAPAYLWAAFFLSESGR